MLITLIGSGNVATHVGAALKNAGHRILEVYSRDMRHAAALAYPLKAVPADQPEELDGRADLFLIAVNDDAIPRIAEPLARFGKPLVHTSGATALDALLPYTEEAGVLYPLQTFSKYRELDFRTVPLCIEASTASLARQLAGLAETLSDAVFQVDSARRRTLHLAAVFACNFPNALYHAAADLLSADGLGFQLLRPLILETALKVQSSLPGGAQTGPAIRGDGRTMAAHLELLSARPELQDLYRRLSQLIIKMDDAGHEGE